MDRSPLNTLARELRDQIYQYVLGYPSMTVTFDAQGVSDDGLEHFLALTKTCKEAREESAEYVVQVGGFLLRPHVRLSEFSNWVMEKPFDLNGWLSSVSKFPKMRPRVVMLHLGQLAVEHLLHTRDWQAEYSHMLKCIPLPTATDNIECDFHVQVSVVDEAGDILSFSFQVLEQGEYFTQIREAGRESITSIVSQQKDRLKLTNHAWSSLEAAEIAEKRRRAYMSLSFVQSQMVSFPGDLGRIAGHAANVRDIVRRYGSVEEHHRVIREALITP